MNLELDRGDRNPPGEKASAAASRSANDGTLALPEDALIILPVRRMVLFPGMILPIALGREASIAAAQAAAKAKRPVGVLFQRNPETEKPGPGELSLVGTVASIVRYVTTPDGTHHVICQGQQRFRVVEYLEGYPFMVARVGRGHLAIRLAVPLAILDDWSSGLTEIQIDGYTNPVVGFVNSLPWRRSVTNFNFVNN